MRNYRLLFLALFAFSLTITGCDSNNDDEDPAVVFETMGDMMSTSFSALGAIAAEIFLNQATKQQPIYSCENGGQVEYTELSATPAVYSLDFNDCDGTNGNIDLGLDVSFSETNFNFSLSLDGTLQNECTLQFSNFQESISTNVQDESAQGVIIIDGAISASCDGQSYTCAFNQAELAITEDTDDYTLFENSCSLTN